MSMEVKIERKTSQSSAQNFATSVGPQNLVNITSCLNGSSYASLFYIVYWTNTDDVVVADEVEPEATGPDEGRVKGKLATP